MTMTPAKNPCLATALIATLVLLQGCTWGSKKKEETPTEATSPEPTVLSEPDETASFPAAEPDAISFTDIEDALAIRVIYFDYDSSNIRSDQRLAVEAHGQFLANNPTARLVLEGHADERGSREYNLALGERRAVSVRQQMVLLGAAENQIRVVSYGEERPAVNGRDETAWQQNRRVEILY